LTENAMSKTITLAAARRVCCAEGLAEFLKITGLTGRTSITVAQLLRLLSSSDDATKADAAVHAPGLSPAQRYGLGLRCENRAWIYCVAVAARLTPAQRLALAARCSLTQRSEIATYARGLSARQRYRLAMSGDPARRLSVAEDAPGLSAGQRFTLRMSTCPSGKPLTRLA
jgi:hypothetical protein